MIDRVITPSNTVVAIFGVSDKSSSVRGMDHVR